MMAINSVFSRWSEEAGFDLPHLLEREEAHVLAVDDSLVDRKVIERLLKIYSCKVTAVDSGRRALQFLGLDEEVEDHGSGVEGLKVDLIITDYCMPGMTGYELLKKIKESAAFREIPVVIMSSENVHTRIDRCLEEGAEDFIVKPVKLSDLERLKEHLTARDNVLKSRSRSLSSNKRKQPDARDLSVSSESESSPSSQSLASTPSPSPPPSSRSSPSPLSSSPDSLHPTTEPSDSPTPTPTPTPTPDPTSEPSDSASRGVKSPRSSDGVVPDSLL